MTKQLPEVPFDSRTGEMLDYAGYGVNIAWLPNDPFEAVMVVEDIQRGRSTAKFILRDEETNRKWYMFMTDALHMMQTGDIFPGGRVDGRWVIQKRGTNYGVRLVKPYE